MDSTKTSSLILDKILDSTYTKADALHRLRAFKDLAVTLTFRRPEASGVLNTRPKTASAQQTPWLVSIGTEIYKSFDRKNIYQIFNELERNISETACLTIYVPFEIPDSELAELANYLRKDYGKRFLLDLKLNPAVIAGTILVWKGLVKDYSLKKKVEDNSQLITKTIKQFLPHPGH